MMSRPSPDVVQTAYDPESDTFTGTIPLVTRLAARAIQQHGWYLGTVDEKAGLVTFETRISWGSWTGLSGSLSIREISPNKFKVSGAAKQNIRGFQLLSFDLFGEEQSTPLKAIETMKTLAV